MRFAEKFIALLTGSVLTTGAIAQEIHYGNTEHYVQAGFEVRSGGGQTLDAGDDFSSGSGCPTDIAMNLVSTVNDSGAYVWHFGGVEHDFVHSEFRGTLRADASSGSAAAWGSTEQYVHFSVVRTVTLPIELQLEISDVGTSNGGSVRILDNSLEEIVRIEVSPELGTTASFSGSWEFDEAHSPYRLVTSISAVADAGTPGPGQAPLVRMRSDARLGAPHESRTFEFEQKPFTLSMFESTDPDGVEMTVVGSAEAADEDICDVSAFDELGYRRMTRLDLTTAEDEFEFPLEDGTTMRLWDLRMSLDQPGAPAAIDDDGSALLGAWVRFEFEYEILGGAERQPQLTPFAVIFLICAAYMDSGDPSPGAGLTFPGIQLAIPFDLEGGPSIVLGLEGDLVGTEVAPCAADVDADGSVGVGDLLAVLAAWGPCPDCAADISGDGTVDVADLLTILAAWGPC